MQNTLINDFSNILTLVSMLTFLGGIVVSLFTSYLYEQITGKISFRSKEYPDLRGLWSAKIELSGVSSFEETIKITSQLNRKFRGFYTSPAVGRLANLGVVTLQIEGFILDKSTIRYVAHSKNHEHIDYVTGLAVISNDRKTISGFSVSMGILTTEPTVAAIVFEHLA